MGEVIALATVGAVFGFATLVAVLKAASRPKATNVIEEHRGAWRRCQETVAGRDHSLTRVVLIREHQGRETGRLVVAEIKNNDPSWTSKVQEAIAEADYRRETLEYGDHQ